MQCLQILLLFGFHRHRAKSRTPSCLGDRHRGNIVNFVLPCTNGFTFRAGNSSICVSQLRKFPLPVMRTHTSLHGNCCRSDIRKIFQHFFALQTLVFNQPVVAAVDGGEMKNMLGNIHADYGLILFALFDSLFSLVRVLS